MSRYVCYHQLIADDCLEAIACPPMTNPERLCRQAMDLRRKGSTSH